MSKDVNEKPTKTRKKSINLVAFSASYEAGRCASIPADHHPIGTSEEELNEINALFDLIAESEDENEIGRGIDFEPRPEKLVGYCDCLNNSGSTWIEEPPESQHAYRVQCSSCEKFAKWGTREEAEFWRINDCRTIVKYWQF